MKTKIFYLTRSYYPYQKGGGPLMRTGAVKYLKELGWDVTVVMPNFETKDFIIENDIWQIPFENSLKWSYRFQRVGIYEDYLDSWIKKAYLYLKSKIKQEDIIFSTSGGELGMIKLGSLLKETIKCKFVVNFRDPLSYSLVNEMKINNKFHISREKQEKKYLSNSDLIITSSSYYAKSLINKYHEKQDKIKNNYFGFIDKITIENSKPILDKKIISVAYVGTMSELQKPELLYEIYKRLPEFSRKEIKIYYIGNRSKYKPLQNINDKNIEFIDFIPHANFLEFMIKNIDIGFVSLTSDYLGACVPSKIYEYINLGLPMLGALPKGDGMDIINHNKYGIANRYDDLNSLVKSMQYVLDKEVLSTYKKNILLDKESWYMKNRILEVDDLLRKI